MCVKFEEPIADSVALRHCNINKKFSCDSSNEVSKWFCRIIFASVASPKYKFDQKVTDVATILLKVVIWLLVFDIYNSSKTKYFDTCHERLYLYVIAINLHHLLLTSLFILKPHKTNKNKIF